MKSALVFVSVAVAVCAGISFAPEEVHEHWENFKTTYGKSYHPDHEEARKDIFHGHLGRITEHNLGHDLGKHSYRLGLNEFADLTHEEFVPQMMASYSTRDSNNRKTGRLFVAPSHDDAPASIDWRDKGYVTPVKNQNPCGACWTFAACGALEGQWFKKNNKLVPLSEQQLVDCVKGGGGCSGGAVESAYNYIKDNKGIDTDDSYKYTALNNGTCKFDAKNVGATVSDHVDIPHKDEAALKTAVGTIGPIAALICGDTKTFQFYKDGIYEEPACSDEKLNHGVLVVGYGSDKGKNYWIVKNSWGDGWGMKGYVNMAMDANNHCGIASECVYPVV